MQKLITIFTFLCISFSVLSQHGGYHIFKNISSGNVMCVDGKNTLNETNVSEADFSNKNQQIWWLKSDGNGYYLIESYVSGKVLDVRGASRGDNALIVIYDYSHVDNQKWQIVRLTDSTFKVLNKKSGKALTLTDKMGEEGHKLCQLEYASQANQQWILEPVAEKVQPAMTYYALNAPHTEPMIPKWGFGFMQSAWGDDNGYNYMDTFLDHAKTLRGIDNPSYGKHLHPADVLVLDMYWCDLNWSWPGNMTWSYNRFPDPAGMIQELHDMNFKIMLNYHEGGFGPLWFDKMQDHLNWGVDIPWLDFWSWHSSKEQQVWDLMGNHFGEEKRLMFMARHYTRPNTDNHEGETEGRGIGHTKIPNEDNFEKGMPVHWTGDVEGSWLGFQQTIDGIVYSQDGAMGGWSYLHADCPGHKSGDSPELANRWIQFSDFSPITRNHGIGQRDVWSWGEKVEANSFHSRMLRYRLLPYIYTCSWEIWEHAMPLTRPLKLAYPGLNDGLRYQYMFGPELLVAPVYKPSYAFENEMIDVYLPKGEQWVDYWSHHIYNGGQTVQFDISPTNDKYIPLYVKRGAIIPMGPEIYFIDPAEHPDPLTLDIYPLLMGTSSYTMHDDDGETKAYQNGAYAHTTFSCTSFGDTLEIEVGASLGEYTGKPSTQNYILKVNLMEHAVKTITNGETIYTETDNFQSLIKEDGPTNVWAKDEAHNILYIRFNTSVDIENTISVITYGKENQQYVTIQNIWNDARITTNNSGAVYKQGSDSSFCWEMIPGNAQTYTLRHMLSGAFLSVDEGTNNVNISNTKTPFIVENTGGIYSLKSVFENGTYLHIADSTGYVQAGANEDTLQSAQWIIEPFIAQVSVTGISFAEASIDIELTAQPDYVLEPANASNKRVRFQSLDETVTSVTIDGSITAKTNGSAQIVVLSYDGHFTDTLNITVEMPFISVDSLVCDNDSLFIPLGKTIHVPFKVYPTNATDPTFIWTSENESLATISDNGTLSTISEGTANIIISTEDNKYSDTITVIITEAVVDLQAINIDKNSVQMLVGESLQLNYNISPSAATHEVTWTSSNPEVAYVDQSGMLTSAGLGKTSIVLLADNKRKWDVLSVSVIEETSITSIHEGNEEEPSFTAYPVPVKDSFTVNTTNFIVERIQVQNQSGMVLFEHAHEKNSDVTIDFTSFKPGMYFIQLMNKNNQKIIRVIKE